MSGDSRPSARTLSQIFMKGKDGMGSLRNRTGIATFFGKIDKTHIKTLCVQYRLEIS
jgi:dual oxidase